MTLKAKIFLLAIVPFALAIGGITYGVRQQAESLAQAQHATTQAAYMSSKEIELRHYVELAKSAIAPYYEMRPPAIPAATKNAAASRSMHCSASTSARTATFSSTRCTARR